MNRLFQELLSHHTPQANPAVGNGLATLYMAESEVLGEPGKVEAYIDAVFRSASKSLPEGLVYEGYECCTPAEEYAKVSYPKNNKRTFDLAESSLYAVKYYFSFEGILLPPRYLYLPYISEGGLMMLGGALYHVSPVITDSVISPTFNSVFVRLLRSKIIFERLYHSILVNGTKETSHVVWADIYRKTPSMRKTKITTKAQTTAVHYLLGKYGFTELFRRYTGCVPIVGEEGITPTNYPASEWVICQTTGLRPKSHLSTLYEPCPVKLAIPRSQWTTDVKNLVIGFYYVVDHFPTRIRASYVDNTTRWMILLGHIIFSGIYGEGRLYDQAKEHYDAIDKYVDTIIAIKLKELGYDIPDFYDLLFLIIQQFDQWVAHSAESTMSMYNKTLEVLYYILIDVTSAIFRTIFRLDKLATKNKLLVRDTDQPKKITRHEIERIFNKYLQMGKIFGLTRSNLAVSGVSYSGDNMYTKIASTLVMQQNSVSATRGRRTRTLVDSSKRLDISVVEGGSLLFLSKSNPTPAVRANLFMSIDLETGRIIPKEHFRVLREKTAAMLKTPHRPDE